MAQINQLLYIPIAFVPSLIWLFWYLRKDVHPEPKRMVLSIFIWGMLVAFPAILLENLAISFVRAAGLPSLLELATVYILGVALIEEAVKFAVVRFKVLNTTELDEPVDAMIYMIIAALGFAAIENVFLLTPLFAKGLLPTLELAFLRFTGATFIHVLASATIGYYLALSLYDPSKKFSRLIHGFLFAILLHGLYNILVIQMEDHFPFLFPVAFLIVFSAAGVSMFFRRLARMQSISIFVKEGKK